MARGTLFIAFLTLTLAISAATITFSIVECRAATRSVSSGSPAPSPGAGTAPPQYRWIMVVVRLTRLPRSLARSELKRVSTPSSEKFASCPSGISRITK